jgi:hypothetical protein
MNDQNKYSRRKFLDSATRGCAGLMSLSMFNKIYPAIRRFPDVKSRVVMIQDESASIITTENNQKVYGVDQNVTQAMIDEGIFILTNMDDPGEAWKSLFPGITKDKIICIKVNCIARGGGGFYSYNPTGLASHPEVVSNIINGLVCMQFGDDHFPEENIIIWDRSDLELVNAGFTLNKSVTGVKCYGTREKASRDGPTGGYGTTEYTIVGTKQRLSPILENADYLINLCLLKDHGKAGVTISLKNHFGSINAPEAVGVHSNRCNPAIPEINQLELVRNKQVLCICDAIYAIISGGPGGSPQVAPNRLLFSKDTVALDTIGGKLLVEHGMREDKYTSKAKYIVTASQAPFNLGTNDPNQIELIKKTLTTSVDCNSSHSSHPADFEIFQNYPNPFNLSTNFSYRLHRTSHIKIVIMNARGQQVCQLMDTQQSGGYHRVCWNGMTDSGSTAVSGIYLAHFHVGKAKQTLHIQLIK